MPDDDPVTGRRFLTEKAYADDRHVRSRMAILRYAEGPADPRWRTSPVAWDGTQVVADIGCGSGFDLRLLVPDGRCRHAFAVDLSAGMLRSLGGDLRDSGRVTPVQADAQRLPLRDGGVDVALCMHMLYHVPRIEAAVGELRRIVAPGGTALVSTVGTGAMAEINDLLYAAVSEQTGRPVRARPAMSFTTETGEAILRRAFADVTLRRHDLTLSIPGAAPVTAYLDSMREPLLLEFGEPFDYDAMLACVAAGVEREVKANGRFRTVSRMGVFICR
jgi:SAM-dependent methyltransferase